MPKYITIHEGAGIDRLHLGDLRPIVDRCFALEDYREAFETMRAARSSHGKIVITANTA
jgi:threonine dehydrogenase-like Zn-dependent dehydrogenase